MVPNVLPDVGQDREAECNQTVTLGVDGDPIGKETTMRSFIIGVLVVAVGVLGYLYWDSQHNTVFKAPGVEIKKS